MSLADNSPRRVCVVGIDPGATSGLMLLSVNAQAMGREDDWRWITSLSISETAKQAATKVENKLALFVKARALLQAHSPAHVAIERPADMETGGFRATGQGAQHRAQAAGTSFAIGESFGMLAAAACDARCRVFAYACTPRRANPAKNKPERVGWMPMVAGGVRGQLWHVMRRDLLLVKLRERALVLRQRPLGGMLRGDGKPMSDHELMAMGVLLFHLSRQVR